MCSSLFFDENEKNYLAADSLTGQTLDCSTAAAVGDVFVGRISVFVSLQQVCVRTLCNTCALSGRERFEEDLNGFAENGFGLQCSDDGKFVEQSDNKGRAWGVYYTAVVLYRNPRAKSSSLPFTGDVVEKLDYRIVHVICQNRILQFKAVHYSTFIMLLSSLSSRRKTTPRDE